MDMMKMSYENSNYGSYFARWKIWEPGIEAIKEHPWIGVGTGDHQSELDKKFIEYNYFEGVGLFNMHNQYLQTLLTHGVVGLLILLSILFRQFRKAVLNRDSLYLSFLTLFSLGCLTESMLNRNKGFIFFVLFSFIFYKSSDSQ
jgi:O-antigen ligase